MSSSPTSLLDLSTNSLGSAGETRARITGFAGEVSIVERLQEMGMHHGMIVQCLGRTPFKGPLLYRMGATVVALRNGEAQCILIQTL